MSSWKQVERDEVTYYFRDGLALWVDSCGTVSYGNWDTTYQEFLSRNRLNGPNLVSERGSVEYAKGYETHRDEGPAVYSHQQQRAFYYVRGRRISHAEFLARTL